jgi:glutamate transport system substrate-binding protein
MKLPRLFIVALLAATVAGCGKEAAAEGSSADVCGQPIALTVAQNASIPNSPTYAKMRARGHVIAGIKAEVPGLAYKTAGNDRCGFDVDIARLISAGLGFSPDTIEYKEISASNREAAIQTGQVDYHIGGYSITDKRKQQVSFAGPYLQTGQALLVRADETDVRDRASLWGKKVCASAGTLSVQRIKDQRLTAPENIIELKESAECLGQMLDGNVDVVTTDQAILSGYAAAVPGRVKLVGTPFSVERYGVGLALNDTSLRNAMNDILERAIRDGTWQRFYDVSLGRSGVGSAPPPIDRY